MKSNYTLEQANMRQNIFFIKRFDSKLFYVPRFNMKIISQVFPNFVCVKQTIQNTSFLEEVRVKLKKFESLLFTQFQKPKDSIIWNVKYRISNPSKDPKTETSIQLNKQYDSLPPPQLRYKTTWPMPVHRYRHNSKLTQLPEQQFQQVYLTIRAHLSLTEHVKREKIPRKQARGKGNK